VFGVWVCGDVRLGEYVEGEVISFVMVDLTLAVDPCEEKLEADISRLSFGAGGILYVGSFILWCHSHIAAHFLYPPTPLSRNQFRETRAVFLILFDHSPAVNMFHTLSFLSLAARHR